MMFLDRLASFVTGLGTAKDKSTTASHVHVLRDRVELEAAYRDNWIARKAIDIVPFDMLRAWRGWQADPEQIGAIEAAETAFGLRGKILAAMIRGRLYGGGVILIGNGDADPSQELVIDRLPKGGIQYLHVLSRYELTAGETQRDPLSPYYGEPSYYEIASANRTSQRVHPSRVVRFLGAPRPDAGFAQEDGWSDSILQAILDSVDQATSAAQHIAAMLPEAMQDVVFVPGLSSHLSTEPGTTALTERFAYAKRIKSMFGMMLLEGDGSSPTGETYQQKQLSFASLPDVARLFLQIASGAADIPVTRMLGQAPAGLNATGDSDTRNYYDNVSAKQSLELTPGIRRLDRALIRHALGEEPASVWYAWNPLYQPSDKEKAEVAKSHAETAQIYASAALVPEGVLLKGVRGRLIEDGTFPGIEDAYKEHGDSLVPEEPQDDLGPDGLPVLPPNVLPFRRQATADAAPRTLYVSRKLKNAADLVAWAKSQGFAETMPASEMHVTIAYSRAPVDWMKVAPTWQGEELKIDAGGPRIIETFGKATVLLFSSGDLQWRHRDIGEAGATWDHLEYQPHVTFTYDPGDVDLAKVQAYNGPLVFGPEIFAGVDEDWQAKAGGLKDALPFDTAADEEIAAVTYEDLLALFSEEALTAAGVTRLIEDARKRRPSHGGGGKFEEGDHPRDANGRFASGSTDPKAEGNLTKGAQALKDSGVGLDDGITVLSPRMRKYAGHDTVASFVNSHPRGKAYALRALAADHKAGRIGFVAARAPVLPAPVLAEDDTHPGQIPKPGTPERRFHDTLLEAGGVFGPQAKVRVMYLEGGRPRGFTVDTGSVDDIVQRSINIYRGEGTKRSVDHDLFMLGDKKRPPGQAKRFLAKSVEAYRHIGIDEVRLHANINVGGYAWLKYGFKPDAASASDLAAHALGKAKALKDAGAIDEATFGHLKRALDNRDFHAASDIGGAAKVKHAGKNQSLGKHLFLGSDWNGKLDLYSPSDMARFNAYVSKAE